MAKINLNRNDRKELNTDDSYHPDTMKSLGLEVNDKFTLKSGIKVVVVPCAHSERLTLQPLHDTGLEQTTEEILTKRIDLNAGEDFVKQYMPPHISKNYRIDFALPVPRIAVEPHGMHLWNRDGNDEQRKEETLNDAGWDVIWLDGDDLDEEESAAAYLENKFKKIISRITFELKDGNLHLSKIMAESDSTFNYGFEETVEEASLSGEGKGTAVVQGRLEPLTIAKLHTEAY